MDVRKKHPRRILVMKNNFAKGLLLSVVSLVVGFVAIGVPFKIFDFLSADGMRILFAVEVAIYLLIGAVFLTIQEKKKKQREQEMKRHEKRQLKVKECVDNWYNIAA